MIWFLASLRNRHVRKDLLPTTKDARNFIADIRDHLRLELVHAVRYSPLQKLAYGGVLFILFPLIILTGLSMSPGMNAVLPWLPELFGGRQSARTVHFAVMALLTGFFAVHMIMVVLAGPLNELRSIVTGRYRFHPLPERTPAMSKLIVSRRSLLRAGLASAASLPLAGCSAYDFLQGRDNAMREFMISMNRLTYRAQRLLQSADQLAPEFAESDIRQDQHPNGSTDPDTPDYLTLKERGFSDYALQVDGLVDRPTRFSLSDLRAMPSRTQITRHDCVEGWSCIAKWQGVPLRQVSGRGRGEAGSPLRHVPLLRRHRADLERRGPLL